MWRRQERIWLVSSNGLLDDFNAGKPAALARVSAS